MGYYSEPFLMRLAGVRELRRRGEEFWLTAAHGSASLTVTNDSEEPRRVALHPLLKASPQHSLAAGSWLSTTGLNREPQAMQ